MSKTFNERGLDGERGVRVGMDETENALSAEHFSVVEKDFKRVFGREFIFAQIWRRAVVNIKVEVALFSVKKELNRSEPKLFGDLNMKSEFTSSFELKKLSVSGKKI